MNCPACGHPNKVGRLQSWYLRRIWRQGPACAASVEGVTAWGQECGCPDLWHVAGT